MQGSRGPAGSDGVPLDQLEEAGLCRIRLREVGASFGTEPVGPGPFSLFFRRRASDKRPMQRWMGKTRAQLVGKQCPSFLMAGVAD